MAYTTLELITRAWVLTGVVSRELQTVTGRQFDDGLFCLNSLFAIQTANMGLIPFFREYDFNGVIGQEQYFIPGLIQLETLTFNIVNGLDINQSVRYPMMRKTREEYFATPRANSINSLPYMYHTERSFEGTNLYMYYFPDQTYPFKLWGKFGLASTVPNQDLSLIYDPFYLEYLRYALAVYLCEEYSVVPSPNLVAKLKQYEQIIRDTSETDFSQKIYSQFNGHMAINYAYANLPSGYTVPGG